MQRFLPPMRWIAPAVRQGSAASAAGRGFAASAAGRWLALAVASSAIVAAAPLSAQMVKGSQVTTDTVAASYRLRTRPLAVTPVALDTSKFSFTAPGRIASSHTQAAEHGFTFTPSRNGKAGLSVGAKARAIAPATRVASPASPAMTAESSSGVAPSGYDFDLSLGYRGFAVSGGVSRIDNGLAGGVAGGLTGRASEGIDVGVGYGGNKWQAGLQASAEKETQSLIPHLGASERYTVEAKGAVDLSSKISVGGTLRYRPPTQNPTPLDQTKSDRAVLVGGAVAF